MVSSKVGGSLQSELPVVTLGVAQDTTPYHKQQ